MVSTTPLTRVPSDPLPLTRRRFLAAASVAGAFALAGWLAAGSAPDPDDTPDAPARPTGPGPDA